jgi:hypothetical protein
MFRSWSPAARAARQAANSPQFRSSDKIAGTGPGSPGRPTGTRAPTDRLPRRSSRTLKPNQTPLSGTTVRTASPETTFSPTSGTSSATVPADGACSRRLQHQLCGAGLQHRKGRFGDAHPRIGQGALLRGGPGPGLGMPGLRDGEVGLRPGDLGGCRVQRLSRGVGGRHERGLPVVVLPSQQDGRLRLVDLALEGIHLLLPNAGIDCRTPA